MQGKLLRFLQERAFERVGGRRTFSADVRVVCATHQGLEALVEAGRFREDLYYRIPRRRNRGIPPLRSRGAAEVEQLARHFADMYAKRYKRPAPVLLPDALTALREHTFPGNVRELEHWIESAVVLAPDGRIGAGHLRARDGPSARRRPCRSPRRSPPGAVPLPLGLPLDEAIRRYVSATVDDAAGNKAEAARRLEIARNTIGRYLKSDPDPD